MSFISMRRVTGVVAAAAGAALLSGCFMVPGKFESEMELMEDGSFTYSYDGEITLLGLTQLAQMSGGPFGGSSSEVIDVDAPCVDYDWDAYEAALEGRVAEAEAMEEAAETEDEVAAEDAAEEAAAAMEEATVIDIIDESEYSTERECTAEEIAERQEQADRVNRRNERQARQMSALFGGIDPTDPEAGNEIASRLNRQYGWDNVRYLGNGTFDIEYSVSSRLTHDFSFPMVEGMSAAQPFLYAYRRDGAVRIDAPGLAVNQSAPYPGGMGGMGGMGALNLLAFGMTIDTKDDEESEQIAAMLGDIGGTFTLITHGEVLANNTDEGFERMGDGRRKMTWTVDAQTKIAPMALIGM